MTFLNVISLCMFVVVNALVCFGRIHRRCTHHPLRGITVCVGSQALVAMPYQHCPLVFGQSCSKTHLTVQSKQNVSEREVKIFISCKFSVHLVVSQKGNDMVYFKRNETGRYIIQ